jgi:hypothetical protein
MRLHSLDLQKNWLHDTYRVLCAETQPNPAIVSVQMGYSGAEQQGDAFIADTRKTMSPKDCQMAVTPRQLVYGYTGLHPRWPIYYRESWRTSGGDSLWTRDRLCYGLTALNWLAVSDRLVIVQTLSGKPSCRDKAKLHRYYISSLSAPDWAA